MNILILNWRDIKHPLSGGAEISLFEHAKYWAKMGANVTWFASSFAKSKNVDEIEGVRIIRKGSHYTVHFFAFIDYLFKRLNKQDVVVDCFHFLPFFTPLYFKQTKIIALINEVAGKVWFSNITLPFSLIGYLIEPLFFNFYRKNKFITSSQSTKKELISLGISSDNINIVNHGVTIKKIDGNIVKNSNPVIIFLGRISKDKGIGDALKAFRIASERIGNLEFWIVGKEEKKGFLNNLFVKNNLIKVGSKIKYFNYVNENEKFKLLKKSWILVHPSKKEGWGLNVIEAASQGAPAIGYDREGLRDSIINDKTGLLIDPNPESLAKAIIKLIEDKELYSRLKAGAKNWAGNFSWEESNKKSWGIIVG